MSLAASVGPLLVLLFVHGQGHYVPSSAVYNSCFLCLGGLCLRLSWRWLGGGDPISLRARRLTSFVARKGFCFRGLIQDHPVA
jgi:hypothetical protein